MYVFAPGASIIKNLLQAISQRNIVTATRLKNAILVSYLYLKNYKNVGDIYASTH